MCERFRAFEVKQGARAPTSSVHLSSDEVRKLNSGRDAYDRRIESEIQGRTREWTDSGIIDAAYPVVMRERRSGNRLRMAQMRSYQHRVRKSGVDYAGVGKIGTRPASPPIKR